MNTQILEQIKKEISSSYIPYYDININFIKTFAKERNVILTEEESEYIFKLFQKENIEILLNFSEETSIYKVNEQVLDWTNKFKTPPTLQEVRKYVKKLVDEAIKFATLLPDWFIDVIGNRKKREHIIKSSRRQCMNEEDVKRHNLYIKDLEELINNSTYESSENNTKPDKKPDIAKYHYFISKVKIVNKEYKIVLHTEQYVGESEKKPQTVHLYDVLEVNKKTSGTHQS